MARLLVSAFAITLIIGVASLAASSAGERGASASQPLEWGNWTCAEDAQDTASFVALMRYIADAGWSTGDCPDFGTDVTHLDQTLKWGDANCDGDLTDLDALLLLLWYAELGDIVPDCPQLGEPLQPAPTASPTPSPAPIEADWEADSSAFEVIGAYPSGPAQVNFSNQPTLVRSDGYAHNNGPDQAGGTIFSRLEVQAGSLVIRWIGQTGETCFDPADQQVPCGEGNNGQQTDTCLDGVDNDSDSATDGYDTDCPEIHRLGTGIFQFPNNGGAVYDRYFTVRCLEAGPVTLVLSHHVEPAQGVIDPDPSNNDSQTTISGECFLSKGSPSGASAPQSARTHRSAPGDNRQPAALPQTGGRP